MRNAVAKCRDELGASHPATLRALRAHAEIKAEIGEHAGALHLMKAVHAAFRMHFGDEHPETAAALEATLGVGIKARLQSSK